MSPHEKQKLCKRAVEAVNRASAELAVFANELDDVMSLTLDDAERAKLSAMIDKARADRREQDKQINSLREFVTS